MRPEMTLKLLCGCQGSLKGGDTHADSPLCFTNCITASCPCFHYKKSPDLMGENALPFSMYMKRQWRGAWVRAVEVIVQTSYTVRSSPEDHCAKDCLVWSLSSEGSLALLWSHWPSSQCTASIWWLCFHMAVKVNLSLSYFTWIIIF